MHPRTFLPDGTVVLPERCSRRDVSPSETSRNNHGLRNRFGPVIPDTPVGTIAEQPNKLLTPVEMLFGQTPATLSYDGLFSIQHIGPVCAFQSRSNRTGSKRTSTRLNCNWCLASTSSLTSPSAEVIGADEIGCDSSRTLVASSF